MMCKRKAGKFHKSMCECLSSSSIYRLHWEIGKDWLIFRVYTLTDGWAVCFPHTHSPIMVLQRESYFCHMVECYADPFWWVHSRENLYIYPLKLYLIHNFSLWQNINTWIKCNSRTLTLFTRDYNVLKSHPLHFSSIAIVLTLSMSNSFRLIRRNFPLRTSRFVSHPVDS